MIIGTKEFDTSHTHIMGILNVTPDSFSDGGKWTEMDVLLRHVDEMVAEGASIIDIGGESTRPGYRLLPDEEEIERVVPVIERVKKEFDVPISLDTYKSAVAIEGIKAGADLINDIWGLKYDEKMAEVIAKNKVACCLMHNRKDTDYTNFMQDVLSDLEQSVEIAMNAGISYDRICIDPGVGFAKSYEQNLQVINEMDKLHALGLPILLGTSRKSVIGLTLDLPVDDRLEGTLVTTVVGVNKGAAFVRVHDVKENMRAIKMAEAILNKR